MNRCYIAKAITEIARELGIAIMGGSMVVAYFTEVGKLDIFTYNLMLLIGIVLIISGVLGKYALETE